MRRNFSSRQPLHDQINTTYEAYQEENMLSTTAVPNSTHEKWKLMNTDWDAISRHLRQQPRMITETVTVSQVHVTSNMPDILVTQPEGNSEFVAVFEILESF